MWFFSGSAEFCRTQLVDNADLDATRINCQTGGHPSGAMLPQYYDTDRECLDRALEVIGLTEPPDAKILWARNTLQVVEVECSAAYRDAAAARNDLEILTDPRDLVFDPSGNLQAFDTAVASVP